MTVEGVRWCPECDEPHIGGCPWAELDKRADPTVPMPAREPTTYDQVSEKVADGIEVLVATFTRLGESAEHHFGLHWLAGALVASGFVAFAGFGWNVVAMIDANTERVEANTERVEIESRHLHERIMEIEIQNEMQRARMEEVRERLIEALREAQEANDG